MIRYARKLFPHAHIQTFDDEIEEEDFELEMEM
jgi:hypothetical protein